MKRTATEMVHLITTHIRHLSRKVGTLQLNSGHLVKVTFEKLVVNQLSIQSKPP